MVRPAEPAAMPGQPQEGGPAPILLTPAEVVPVQPLPPLAGPAAGPVPKPPRPNSTELFGRPAYYNRRLQLTPSIGVTFLDAVDYNASHGRTHVAQLI